jgi:hypothetical protein
MSPWSRYHTPSTPSSGPTRNVGSRAAGASKTRRKLPLEQKHAGARAAAPPTTRAQPHAAI